MAQYRLSIDHGAPKARSLELDWHTYTLRMLWSVVYCLYEFVHVHVLTTQCTVYMYMYMCMYMYNAVDVPQPSLHMHVCNLENEPLDIKSYDLGNSLNSVGKH